MRKIAALVLIFMPALIGPQINASPDLPNLEGWKLVENNESNFEAKIQANGLVYTIYFGYGEDYQNPKDSNEFVRVIKRYVPVVAIVEDDQQKQTIQTGIISNYSRKASNDALSKVRSQADTVGYTKWHTAKDLRTGEDILTSNPESWLRIQNGDWVSGAGVIEQELYSEISPDSNKPTIVGIKLCIGDKYHIMRVDQADLAGKKEEKK